MGEKPQQPQWPANVARTHADAIEQAKKQGALKPLDDYKLAKAAQDRYERQMEEFQVGELVQARAAEQAKVREATEAVRKAAKQRYDRTGVDSESILRAIGAALINAHQNPEGVASWLGEFLMTGPVTDAPEGKAKGSRSLGGKTVDMLSFAGRKIVVKFFDATEVKPEDESE